MNRRKKDKTGMVILGLAALGTLLILVAVVTRPAAAKAPERAAIELPSGELGGASVCPW